MRHPRAVGVFLEFRAIPVLLWSYTATCLGTAVAFLETGRFDAVWFLAALFLATMVQGFVTHSLNEIYDWRSGTDRHASPRVLSGGSKVLNARLLTERDLWRIFSLSSAGVLLVGLAVIGLRSILMLPFVVVGLVSGIAYTAPPLRLSYRPFVGEWFGGFLGVFIAGTGAYAIQTLTLSLLVVITATAHASTCVGMLLVHHYLDATADAAASPPKRTTVVLLGPERSRSYASAFAAAAVILTAILAALAWPFLLALPFAVAAFFAHRRVDPSDTANVTRTEVVIIQCGISEGLLPAALLAPWLIFPALLAVPLYAAHFWLATSREMAERAAAVPSKG